MLAITVTLNLVGLVLLARRIHGTLLEPLPPGKMLTTAVIAFLLTAFGRTAWRRIYLTTEPGDRFRLPVQGQSDKRLIDWNGFGWHLVGWGSSIGILLLAIGCAHPGDRLSDWLIWLPLCVADQFLRQSFFDGGKPTPMKVPFQQQSQEGSPSEETEQIMQQLFRIRDATGQEKVYGTLRADFKQGQRSTTLYVGFCPPLSHQPLVEAELLEGPDSSMKVAQALAHGARLDLRLDRPAQGVCHVLIDMVALPRKCTSEPDMAYRNSA